MLTLQGMQGEGGMLRWIAACAGDAGVMLPLTLCALSRAGLAEVMAEAEAESSPTPHVTLHLGASYAFVGGGIGCVREKGGHVFHGAVCPLPYRSHECNITSQRSHLRLCKRVGDAGSPEGLIATEGTECDTHACSYTKQCMSGA